jgi:hypothetical protein
LLFLLIAVPWFAEMQRRYPSFLEYFVVHHHLQRFAQSGFNNEHAFWFYLPVLLGLTLPWSLALPAAWRRQRDDAPSHPSGFALQRLMWSWLAVIVIFFSVPRSKLIGYILPALPPFAWLVADAWTRLGPALRGQRSKLLAGLAALLCIGGIGAVYLLDHRSARSLGEALARERSPGAPVVFSGVYPYDLIFYARLTEPVRVLDEWTRQDIAAGDGWRRELVEAARFDRQAAAQRLVSSEAMTALRCTHPEVWLIATPSAVAAEPSWRDAERVATARDAALWRLKPPADCPQKPSDG